MICQNQREQISEELEKDLFKAIFNQRKLKSCKNLIGKCRIYPERRRCSMVFTEAQLFRIYTTANNLRIKDKIQIRSLTDEQRKKVIEVLNGYSDIFNKSGKVTL